MIRHLIAAAGRDDRRQRAGPRCIPGFDCKNAWTTPTLYRLWKSWATRRGAESNATAPQRTVCQTQTMSKFAPHAIEVVSPCWLRACCCCWQRRLMLYSFFLFFSRYCLVVAADSGGSDHPAQQNWAVARVPREAWEAKRNDRALLAELTQSIGGE